jgi:hypothetical protein
MPLDWGDPCTSVLKGDPNRDREKTAWTEDDRSLDKLKWRAYPTLPPGGEKEGLKRGNSGGHQWTTDFPGPLLLGEVSCFTFSFCSSNKSLLNCLTIFLALNSSSGREKEPVPLDSNSICCFHGASLLLPITQTRDL